MNGSEIIKRARAAFGEQTALSVQEVTFREWVNSAVQELYTHLPPRDLRPLITSAQVPLTEGKGEVPNNVDRVVDVADDKGLSLFNVETQIIRSIDFGTYFEPVQQVFAIRDKDLWVRPKEIAEVEIVYLSPPDHLATGTVNDAGDFGPSGPDLSTIGILPNWHIALVHLVTAYAYAQEEDVDQASLYRGLYQQMVMPPQGESAGGPDGNPR